MKALITSLLLIQAVLGMSQTLPASTGIQNLHSKPDSLSYTITPVNGTQYGYDIYVNGRLRIHQPTIPGQPGNAGFTKREDAKKVALLVIDKINKGIMPPTVTQDELKNLGIAIK
jgi:Domain of unknown function (DUF4907)